MHYKFSPSALQGTKKIKIEAKLTIQFCLSTQVCIVNWFPSALCFGNAHLNCRSCIFEHACLLLVFFSVKREERGGHYQIQVHAEFRLMRLPLLQ